jgi:hypothetical protein
VTCQREKVKTTTALWVCDGCTLWWISQAAEEPQTWRLFPLAEPDSPRWSSMPPAWKVTGPDPSVCPQCGTRMSEHALPNPERLTPFMAMQN